MNDVLALMVGLVVGLVVGMLSGREYGRIETAKAMERRHQHGMR